MNKIFIKKLLREMDLDTYAKHMNTTGDWPMAQRMAGEAGKEKRHISNRQQNVNALARNRFETEFYKQYPKNSISINTTDGEYTFTGLQFRANYTNYKLIFGPISGDNTPIFIGTSSNGFYIDPKNVNITDEESKQIVIDMLQYNSDVSNR